MKNNNLLALSVLVKRNIKLYLKDKMTVFFSVLAPIIILLLYVLFLGKLQVDSIMTMLAESGIDSTLTTQDVTGIINNWMIAGLMGVSCITVCINTNMVMIKDKATGNINDMLSSPVKRWVIYLSYIISCFVVTLAICLVVLLLAIVYLACTGGLMLSFVHFLAIVGITILSTLSSAFFMVLLCSFIKTTNALAALNGLFSTAIGFLIGAYLPFSMLPGAMQYIACFIPGTYSVGLYKEYFLSGYMQFLGDKLPADSEVFRLLNENYSLSLDFFGHEVSTSWMAMVLVISIVLFAGVLAILYSKKKTNFFNATKKRLKKRKP